MRTESETWAAAADLLDADAAALDAKAASAANAQLRDTNRVRAAYCRTWAQDFRRRAEAALAAQTMEK